MDINEVKAFIESNKDNPEVTAYIGGFVTPDRVKGFLDTEDGRKILQPKLDGHFTKGLETWKANSLPKLIEDEISKRFPAETPEQKKIRELEQKWETSEQARLRETLRNKAITEATQKGLPLEIIDHFVGQDEDSTVAALAKLETAWQAALKAAVEAKFKDNGRTPPKSEAPKGKLEELQAQLAKAIKLDERVALQRQIQAIQKE